MEDTEFFFFNHHRVILEVDRMPSFYPEEVTEEDEYPSLEGPHQSMHVRGFTAFFVICSFTLFNN